MCGGIFSIVSMTGTLWLCGPFVLEVSLVFSQLYGSSLWRCIWSELAGKGGRLQARKLFVLRMLTYLQILVRVMYCNAQVSVEIHFDSCVDRAVVSSVGVNVLTKCDGSYLL